MVKVCMLVFAVVFAIGAAVAQQELPRFGQGGNGNHRPVARDDHFQIREGTSVRFDVLANDSDPDNDQVAITHINGQRVFAGDVVTLPSGAKLTVVSDGKVTIVP